MEQDHAEILELWCALVEHHRYLDADLPTPSNYVERLDAEVARALAVPSAKIVVAAGSEELTGFCLVEAATDGRIHELFVKAEWRRQGIGCELVAWAERFLRESGQTTIGVRVERVNAEARVFWQSLGYEASPTSITVLQKGIKPC